MLIPLIDEVLGSGPSIVLLTRGDRGTEIHTNDGVQKIKAHAKAAKVIDTTGAGDLYASGFLYGIANGKSLEESTLLFGENN